MSQTNKYSFYSLLAVTTLTLSACGSENKVDNNPTTPPQFKWADTAASNNFSPLGDTTDRTPTFSWSAYTDNGSLATEYNFGHQTISGSDWIEYTVPAASAGCAAGGTCSYTPANKVFAIGEQRPWWVRGKINGQWMEWSNSHVFKVVSVTTPPSGSKLPSGDTATTSPIFKWPRIGSASRYEIGIESQSGSGWKSYPSISCTTTSCTYTANYGFSVGDKMTWWVRPAAAAWSNGVDFTITRGGGSSDNQKPTVPSALRSTAITATSTSIRWNASTDNVAVTGYRVYRNGSQVGTTSGTSYTNTSLSPSTRYTYTVRAFDAANNLSANSSSLAVTTESSGGGTTLTPFTWSPTNGANSYTFGIERQNGTGWREYSLSANQLNCQSGTCSFIPSDYGLNIGDQVVWFVKPNGGNWSGAHFSTVAGNGGGADTQAPTVPSSLRQVSVTQTRAVIRWNASTDNTAVTGYRVYRNGSQIATPTGTSYTDNSVTAGNTYSYRVSALDAAGNQSAQSVALSVTTPPNVQQPNVVINEVLAGNAVTNMDTDFYKFSDWIELHNTTNQSQNISGFYLSDDTANARKWKIPAGTTIAANQYLMIWADKKDTKANELHANFSLSSKGETLTLANTAGTVVDTLTYGKVDTGVAVGKSGNTVSYFVPTPKAQNSTAFSSKKGAKKPVLSQDSGFYSSRVNLQLSQENNAEIYYTTDGSTPTANSQRYNGTLQIDETTVIKTLAVENGKLPSKVVTNSYFIGHQTTLPVVSISMDNTHLYDDTVGIYTVGTNGLITQPWCGGVVANYQQDWDRPVYVEYFDQNHNRALAFGADTAITGECSRRKAKKSFGFELDGKYGTKSLSYKLFPGKDLGKIKDFKVRTANSGYRVGDIVGAQLIEKGGLDIDYQAYRAVQMFMNGEYWGVYNIREKKGAETLEANYPNLGKVDIIKAYIVKKGDYTDYGTFNNFLTNNDLASNANYQQALSFFDESSFIDYMAFMIYNGNLDWIGGNMRTWKEKKAGAKWRWMADDIDWGFLSQLDFAGQGTALASNQFNNLKNSDSTTNMVLLFNGLMKNTTFRAKFKARFTTLLDTVFTPSFMLPIVNAINDERKDYMHLEKFAGMPAGDYLASYNDYIENDIRNFVRQRTALVKQQLQQAIP